MVLAQESGTEESSGDDLISVVPGLMIWTAVVFLITFFILRKVAFGRIQGLIEQRRDRIAEALDEADNARAEARSLLEEHRQLIADARSQAEEVLADARRQGEAQRERVKGGRGERRPRTQARGEPQVDRGRESQAARAGAARGCRADADRLGEGDRQDARRRRSATADRRGGRRARLRADRAVELVVPRTPMTPFTNREQRWP